MAHLDKQAPGRFRLRISAAELRWLIALTMAGVYVAIASIHAGDSPRWIERGDTVEVGAVLLAFCACLARTRRERGMQAHRSWLLITVGVGLWASGALGWLIWEGVLRDTVPEPSVMDGLYLFGYLAILGGLLAMVQASPARLSRLRSAMDAMFIAFGFFLCSWSLVIGPVAVQNNDGTLGALVNLTYPVLDALLLAAVFFVTLKRRGSAPAGFGLLVAGVSLWVLSDSLSWYLAETDSSYPTLSPVNAGWVAGFLLIGLAALTTKRADPHPSGRSKATLVLSALPAILGVGTVLVNGLVHGGVASPELVVWILLSTVTLGVALQIVAALEHRALTNDLERRVERRTAELHLTERYYRVLVQHASDAVMVLGPDLSIRYASAPSERVFGFSPEEITSGGLQIFGHEAAATLSEALARVAREPDRIARVSWPLLDRSQRTRRAESTITNLLEDPTIGGYVLNTRDDTDRATLAEQLRNQAFHDPLTGLPNRALLGDRAARAFARSQRTSERLAVLAVDIDAFKLINDGFGHKVGDRLLCEVAKRLDTVVRRHDTVARLGGDEFVVLMDPAPSVETALTLAERIREAMIPEFILEGISHNVSASVGVATGTGADSSFDQLLCDADLALYEVKGSGKNAARMFHTSMSQNASSRLELQSDLRGAIANDELCLLYQPEMRMDSRLLHGFEALLRWNHPLHGLMSPDKFIPLAEETGLINPIGRWVLGEALRQAAVWTLEHPQANPPHISVNVSAVQLRSVNIVGYVREALEQSGLEPGRVVLEVTESSFIECSPTTIDTLRSLKDLGVRLAIDDFGTGYASVANLQSMPIDILKIDRRFVAGADDGPEAHALLEAIVNIGRALSLETVAEGIEHAAQLDMAGLLGCDYAQGYLLGRPLPALEAEMMISGEPLALGSGS